MTTLGVSYIAAKYDKKPWGLYAGTVLVDLHLAFALTEVLA